MLDKLEFTNASYSGVFACTSSGDFCYFALEEEAGHLILTSEEYLMQKLPEPLQQLVFEPATNPSLFAYGGEEIPLSVWDVRKAISRPPQAEKSEAGEDGDKFTAPIVTDERPLHNAKAKKRKRAAELRAKASELMWGEVWRAKNVRRSDELYRRLTPFSASQRCIVSAAESRHYQHSLPRSRQMGGRNTHRYATNLQH